MVIAAPVSLPKGFPRVVGTLVSLVGFAGLRRDLCAFDGVELQCHAKNN